MFSFCTRWLSTLQYHAYERHQRPWLGVCAIFAQTGYPVPEIAGKMGIALTVAAPFPLMAKTGGGLRCIDWLMADWQK